jgi:hypothetical protein
MSLRSCRPRRVAMTSEHIMRTTLRSWLTNPTYTPLLSFVIASEAKQSSATPGFWIASAFRASQ